MMESLYNIDKVEKCDIRNSCCAKAMAYISRNVIGLDSNPDSIYDELSQISKSQFQNHKYGQGFDERVVSSWLMKNKIFGTSFCLGLGSRKYTVSELAKVLEHCGPCVLMTKNHCTVVDSGKIIDDVKCANWKVTDIIYANSEYRKLIRGL